MRTILFALPVMLASCASNSPEQIPERGTGAVCDASALGQFVGMQASADLAERMIALSGAGSFRWLPAGSIVTKEYRVDRLNAHLDETNHIARVNCG